MFDDLDYAVVLDAIGRVSFADKTSTDVEPAMHVFVQHLDRDSLPGRGLGSEHSGHSARPEHSLEFVTVADDLTDAGLGLLLVLVDVSELHSFFIAATGQCSKGPSPPR
jgi:hypothetical protein